MAVEVTYDAARKGDWGAPTTAGGYSTDTLALRDGTSLFYRVWHATDPQAPILVVLHGLGAHTGWFIDMGNALSARGVTVYADDHRGFGRSGGPRGHVVDYHTYLGDIDEFVGEVCRREGDRPITLLGHSMGGLFALYAASIDAKRAHPAIKGLILLNPWIADTGKVAPLTLVQMLLAGVRGSSKLFAVAGGPDVMTTNPEAVRMLDADGYWVRAESAAFLVQIAVKMRGGVLKQAKQVSVPALVLQAEHDKSVVPAKSHAAFEALASEDKTYTVLPGYAHDSELEADRTLLDDTIATWVRAHAL